jgi:DNA polymerase-3 subunit alpha
MPEFVHLHTHTEFSLLDGAAKIEKIMAKACSCGMKAVGISDHGNMYGVPKFVTKARAAGLKPIIGQEFYIAQTSRFDKQDKQNNNSTFHQILFAKNEEGYKNLSTLSSLGFSEGMSHGKPRIDKELLQLHHRGIIATTCCLASEINQLIVKNRRDEAEQVFRWYLELFGADYYVEVQRHGLQDMNLCNEVLLGWAKKYNVKVIATNDVHYVDEEDSEAHDLLLALQTGSDYDDPNRFRFTDDNNQLNRAFYFKTPDEMGALFRDIPEALENTLEIADKCTFELKLNGDLLLPNYPIPPEFESMDAYLRFLTFEGAKKRYSDPLPTDVGDRIETELRIIQQMGFAGYFLIVQEFTTEARRRGVLVGPGRGSAAGSVVAYCTGIIDIDPLQYALLFERFLNPERISPPDIDIDFDDEGRQAVIDFVIERYGEKCVSQIITYGTMGAKTAIKDVGRVLKVPLAETNRIAKYIPERPGVTFAKALDPEENPDGAQALKEAFNSPDPLIRKMMAYAQTLEGTARHTGIHAAGVIIAPGTISDFVPTAVNNAKDNITITQFDGPNAELAGLLKMDFLGLKNLSIIKTAVRLIQKNRGIHVDIDNISLEDPATFELYQRGDTVATFQFESDGMRKYLRELKPTTIEDLIAMNALYRPGPMDNIPSFIARKRGTESIDYPHPCLEPILKNTYGIMVYQEQIMEVARTMAGYSLGGADLLRRAMGKKKKEVMDKEEARFVEGAVKNGIDKKTAQETFAIMAKFASYGFNKSHSAAYSVLAFKTAYLKANFPQEYMAAVLSHNLANIDEVTFLLEECRRMGLKVLPPSANHSEHKFSVDSNQAIRFGLGAIKGLGEASAQAIIEEREANGPFKSIFDLTARVSTKFVNKKALECLVYSGALDTLLNPVHRARYFAPSRSDSGTNMLDLAVQWGNRMAAEKQSSQSNLFLGGTGGRVVHIEPEIPMAEPWPAIHQLKEEHNVIGFYLSGHPLDRYKDELNTFGTCTISEIETRLGQVCRFGCIVSKATERMSKKGTRFGVFVVEDYTGTFEFSLFGEDYPKFQPWLTEGNCVFVTGRYQQRTFGEGQELRVEEVKLLDTLLTQVREIQLMVNLAEINPKFVKDLKKVCEQSKGSNCFLKFAITDPEEKQTLNFNARQLALTPTHDLLDAFKELGIAYTLHERVAR